MWAIRTRSLCGDRMQKYSLPRIILSLAIDLETALNPVGLAKVSLKRQAMVMRLTLEDHEIAITQLETNLKALVHSYKQLEKATHIPKNDRIYQGIKGGSQLKKGVRKMRIFNNPSLQLLRNQAVLKNVKFNLPQERMQTLHPPSSLIHETDPLLDDRRGARQQTQGVCHHHPDEGPVERDPAEQLTRRRMVKGMAPAPPVRGDSRHQE